MPFAARGQRGLGMRELQRRHEHVALADAGVDGLAEVPSLVLATREAFPFPLRRRQDAGLLAFDV